MRQFSVRLTVFILLLFRHARDWRFDVAARKTVTHEGRNRVMEVENIGVVDLSSQPLYLQAEVDRFALPLIRELLKGLHLLATIFEHSGVCAHLLATILDHSGGCALQPLYASKIDCAADAKTKWVVQLGHEAREILDTNRAIAFVVHVVGGIVSPKLLAVDDVIECDEARLAALLHCVTLVLPPTQTFKSLEHHSHHQVEEDEGADQRERDKEGDRERCATVTRDGIGVATVVAVDGGITHDGRPIIPCENLEQKQHGTAK